MIIQGLERESRRLAWEWNPDSEWASADLIVLDEVSMVGPKLAADIEAYGVPVLVLGDPAQLPPVEGGGHYTDRKPDFLLTEIHRQALESPVLELATRVRLSTDSRLGITPADVTPASLAAAMEADQVLVWSNPRRWAMVSAMRRKMGFPAGRVVEGDRIMCLTNNKDLGVFNGQQFHVLAAGQLRDDEGRVREIPMYEDGFAGYEMQKQAKDSGLGIKGKRMFATYAQAITAHKAQGSEWPHVYVVDETPAMMSVVRRREGNAAAVEQARRWMYTAVSRASERVTVTAARR
jgi:exodeoxyribonuclease-5